MPVKNSFKTVLVICHTKDLKLFGQFRQIYLTSQEKIKKLKKKYYYLGVKKIAHIHQWGGEFRRKRQEGIIL